MKFKNELRHKIMLVKFNSKCVIVLICAGVLILDVTQCTTFDCKDCKHVTPCYNYYTDEHFCSFEKLMEVLLGEQVSNVTILPVSLAGFLCTYGKYDTSKIMSPINFAGTLNSEMEYPDIKIISADGYQYCAHKVILAARSEVFSRMLNTNMKEKTTGVIQLKDLNASGLKALLHFIYTGNLSDEVITNVPVLLELLQSADKYNIIALEEYCTEMIWLMPEEHITPEDAIETFIVSQQLRIRMSQEKALNILKKKEAMKIADLIQLTFFKLHDNAEYTKFITKLLGILISTFRK